MKAYCEHGAITPAIRELQRQGRVQLVHFPYDPDARSRHLAVTAMPSEAQWRDMNVSWAELKRQGWTWADLSGSQHLPRIVSLIGAGHRRDALHVDSAYKSGCRVFITQDSDILAKREELSALLDIVFIDPNRDFETLKAILDSDCDAV